MTLYDWEKETEILEAANERKKRSSVKEDGRLQGISDWVWTGKSFLDTMYKDYPKIWREAYQKAFDKMVEQDKKERDR